MSLLCLTTHTPSTASSTLSLHDALPIFGGRDDLNSSRERERGYRAAMQRAGVGVEERLVRHGDYTTADRKSTRLNSSHVAISYAVFCLKKKTIKLQYQLHN